MRPLLSELHQAGSVGGHGTISAKTHAGFFPEQNFLGYRP